MVTNQQERLATTAAAGLRVGGSHYFVPGVSVAMRALEQRLLDIAATDIPVLLAGESGTGKEVMALEIHRLSKHRDEAFVKCGCAGLAPELLVDRFQKQQNGRQNGAASIAGSLFLDEISHLDPDGQARLLQLLPENPEADSEHCLHARIICSTTRNLDEEMRVGRFREELYYRINGVHLHLPALRDRQDDIPALVDFFLRKYSSLFGRVGPRLGPEAMNLLLHHSWPGNIRELENFVRKVVAFGDERQPLADLSVTNGSKSAAAAVPVVAQPVTPSGSLKQAAREASRHAEREMILQQLERTRWNRKRTARDLQISYKALLYKMKQLGLDGSGSVNGRGGELP